MDDIERVRKEGRLEYDVELLKDHKKECDADMEAHGKMLLQADNRMNNIQSTVDRLSGSCDKDRDRFDQAIRGLQDFRLRIVSYWIVTALFGGILSSAFGFIINLIWKKV